MAKPEQKTVSKFIEYLVVRAVNSTLQLLPFGLAVRLTEGLGAFLFLIAGRYRRLIDRHLTQAFPEKDEAWRREISRKNFINMGRMLTEFACTPSIDQKFFKKRVIIKPDDESHREIFRRPGIAILGHLGNWEWHGAVAGLLAERPIYTLVKRHTNFWSNRYLEQSREKANMRLIYVDQNPFIIIKHLKRGEFVAFTSDQDARESGEFFDFLGRPASTFLGPAAVARVTNVPVYFVWSWRDENRRLVLEYEELSRPDLDPKHDCDAWEIEFTRTWVKKLEEKIREHPTEYLWAHNRWKTQPKPN